MSGFLKNIKINLVSILAWTLGLTIFIPFGLLVLALSILINPKHFDPFIKAGCRIVLRFLFIRVQVKGREHLQIQKTYLFMSNHVNLFDGFVLLGHIPNFIRGVELDEHFNWPFWGWIIRRLGMIPISHSNARSAMESLKKAKQMIAEGTSMVILPEGHRTLNGKFSPFKRGAFLLAKEAEVDIVPVVMVGAFEINRKGSLLIRPGKMTLRFGEPILYQDIKELNMEEIASLVHKKMSALSGA
jgi:1-acyl-sn-glycerol-3-phosphate acyltransferase